MNRFILIIFILVLGQYSFAYYDMSTPVEGNSIATDDLQFKVVNALYKIVSKKNPACTDYKIKNTQIIHFPYDIEKKKGEYVKGYWKELWSVDCCANIVQVPITFHIKNRNKTLYVIDKNFMLD